MKSYNLAGVFVQVFGRGNGIFEGLGLKHNEDNNSFSGNLMDYYGPSKIAGSLNLESGVMTFDKRYQGRGDVIDYSFKKEGDIWIGEFNYDGSFGGRASCELYPENKSASIDWKEVARAECFSAEDSERFAKTMVNALIERGYLEVVGEDPETGDKLLVLTNKKQHV